MNDLIQIVQHEIDGAEINLVSRYNELPSLKYNDGVEYIRNLTIGDMI